MVLTCVALLAQCQESTGSTTRSSWRRESNGMWRSTDWSILHLTFVLCICTWGQGVLRI